MCLCRISGAILEGRAKHMEVPSEAVVERPGTRIRACRGREVVLQRGREIVRVAVRACQHPSSTPSQAQDVPEVEVLRQVHLLEDVDQALLLRRLLDLVVEADGNHLRVLAVVEVVAAEQRDIRPLGYEDHVPSGRESHKTYPSKLPGKPTS